ncbi:hypothetical protein D3C72_1270380 [compost metagenome]
MQTMEVAPTTVVQHADLAVQDVAGRQIGEGGDEFRKPGSRVCPVVGLQSRLAAGAR